jgi:putative transposase
MAKEYKYGGHSVHDIQYHLCWCTKYRYPVLRSEIGPRCRDLLRQIAMAREITILRGALAPDHVHMLVSAPPVLAPAKIVQYLKGRSSRKLQMEYEVLRKRYWGQHLWARGYFCATVGTVTEAIIKKYIEHQKWDDDGGKGFKLVEVP